MTDRPMSRDERAEKYFDQIPYDPYAFQEEALFADQPDAWTAVGPGAFAVYFPSDAHATYVNKTA